MTLQALGHLLILCVLIVCYTVLTVHGDDGNPLLGVIGGYIGGTGATVALAKANGGIKP